MAGHRSSGDLRDDLLSVSSSSRPNLLSTFERESHYPIFSAFCNCLSIVEIVSLTRTCKSLSSLYQYLLPVQWYMDKALRRYFDDPHGFRSQVAKCDGLMFGRCANQYFERFVWNCQDLDVAIKQRAGSELFSNYLSYRASYTDMKTSKNIQQHPLMVETRIFKRDADSKTATRLHITKCPPLQVILQGICITVGVCILSWNKAYSIFALSTSIQNSSYLLQPFDPLTKKAAQHDSQKDGVFREQCGLRRNVITTRSGSEEVLVTVIHGQFLSVRETWSHPKRPVTFSNTHVSRWTCPWSYDDGTP